MVKRLRDKLYILKLKYGKKHLKREGYRICVIYFIIGFIWIYFSDQIVSSIDIDKQTLLIVNTYKGIIYVLSTALLLYYLIANMLKKVDSAEQKLNESYDELSAANEELQAYVQQLTASEEELRNQYDHIVEFDKMLQVSEEKYKTLILQMQLGLALYESNDQNEIMNYLLVDTNYSHEELTGLKQEDILGKTFFDVHGETDSQIMTSLNNTIKTGEVTRYERYQERTGYFYEIIAYKPKERQLAIIVNDVTKRKQAEERFHYLSYHDQLTKLYNRRYFDEELILLDKEENYPLMITMADINGLKLINDSFGHAVGDQYIQKAAKVLMDSVSEKEIVCRLAGDEFIIFSPNTSMKEMKDTVNHIKELAQKESVNSVGLSISFGYCAKKNNQESMLDILKKAEDYMYKQKLLDSPSMRGKAIYTIMTALQEKNQREDQHSRRVSELCEKMGMAMGMPEEEVKELKTVGLLHDIGKVAIEEGILNKSSQLTDSEWEEIKKHPEIGYRILSTVNELSEMAEYVLAHHERWDGKGYPKGLKGEEIPIQSRIIAIADAYDAMVSERSYRKALSKEYAISELKKGARTQFCEFCVDVFVNKVIKED